MTWKQAKKEKYLETITSFRCNITIRIIEVRFC